MALYIGDPDDMGNTSDRLAEAIAFDFIHWWRIRDRAMAVMAPNIYLPDWFEADVCSIRRSMLIDEFEIKVSRADFKNDAKKAGADGRTKYDRIRSNDHPLASFTYIAPKGLLTLEDLPDFAGLIEVDLPPAGKPKRKLLGHRLPPAGFNPHDYGIATFQITVRSPKLRKVCDEVSRQAAQHLHLSMAYRFFDCYRTGRCLKKPKPRYPE